MKKHWNSEGHIKTWTCWVVELLVMGVFWVLHGCKIVISHSPATTYCHHWNGLGTFLSMSETGDSLLKLSAPILPQYLCSYHPSMDSPCWIFNWPIDQLTPPPIINLHRTLGHNLVKHSPCTACHCMVNVSLTLFSFYFYVRTRKA